MIQMINNNASFTEERYSRSHGHTIFTTIGKPVHCPRQIKCLLTHFHMILVGFGGILTIAGYLMPNPGLYIYILNIWFVNIFCRYTQLDDLTIQKSTKLNGFKYH